MPWQCGMMLRFQFNNRVALSSCNRQGKKALAFERGLAESLPRSDELLVLKNQILQHGQ